MAAQVNYEVTYQKEYHPDRFNGRPHHENHHKQKHYKQKQGLKHSENDQHRYPTVVAEVSRLHGFQKHQR
jgi:hypothetical protein